MIPNVRWRWPRRTAPTVRREFCSTARPPVRWRWPVAAATLYVLLTAAVLAGLLRPFDRAVADALRSFGADRPALIGAVRILTDVAATEPFLAVGLILGALLLVRRKRAAAGLTLAATALVPILWSLSHVLMTHARPPAGFIHLTSNGFPSGHTANATTLALLAAILLPRPGVRVAAVAFAVFVGMTRLLLLAHYPSQVLGGFLLATAVVLALCRAVCQRSKIRSVRS